VPRTMAAPWKENNRGLDTSSVEAPIKREQRQCNLPPQIGDVDIVRSRWAGAHRGPRDLGMAGARKSAVPPPPPARLDTVN